MIPFQQILPIVPGNMQDVLKGEQPVVNFTTKMRDIVAEAKDMLLWAKVDQAYFVNSSRGKEIVFLLV